jgi:hypothetical protein
MADLSTDESSPEEESDVDVGRVQPTRSVADLEDDDIEPDVPFTAIARSMALAELTVARDTRRTNTHRVDYHKGPGKEAMEEALRDWGTAEVTYKAGRPLRNNMSPGDFAKAHGIPPTTFRKRLANSDPSAAPTLGRPALISFVDQRALVDAVGRLDELNRGKDTGRIIDSIHATFPHLTRDQVGNHISSFDERPGRQHGEA